MIYDVEHDSHSSVRDVHIRTASIDPLTMMYESKLLSNMGKKSRETHLEQGNTSSVALKAL
jgi:hypothetical protein